MLRDHLFPKTVSEALMLLKECKGKARLIAGGTDLIPEIRGGAFDFEILVDIEKIKRLKSIREESRKIFIGSGVTFTELEESKLICQNAQALSQAASLMGSPQIRNRATIGGNIVSAQPAADGTLALLPFDAMLEIEGMKGTREIPISKAYLDVGKSILDPSREILVGIRLEKRNKGEGSNYQRIAVRKAMALPILACGVFLKSVNGSIEYARIGIGPVSNIPFRARETEEFLKGKPLSEGVFEKAGEIASEEVNPRDSKLRGGKEYRRGLAAVIVKRGLQEADREAGLDFKHG
ncbi:MAG: xanthine dehydrogenase family protein subunit M [Thermodesulfobacteriota bacterium]